jgi:hypothetical protein
MSNAVRNSRLDNKRNNAAYGNVVLRSKKGPLGPKKGSWRAASQMLDWNRVCDTSL